MSTHLTETQRNLLTISNEIAEYPPLNLKKSEYQVLLILSSFINSTEKPILGIDDVKELIEERGITDKEEQMQFMQQLMLQQDTYNLKLSDFFQYFEDKRDLDRKMRHYIMEAVQSLDNRKIQTSHPGRYSSITWFEAVDIDTITGRLTFVLGRLAKQILMGLDRNFLQMMAESTVSFSGNSSIPIFLYMKSKLHKGQDKYHGTEELESFQARFGHHEVKTYSRFYDYYRRVLKVAEEDSLKSEDISFTFNGLSKGKGKKVTDLEYHIWRIGNIYTQTGFSGKKMLPEEKKAKEIRKNKIAQLTLPQLRAFEFLKEKDVNYVFLLEEAFPHTAFRIEAVLGYEDIFARLLWKRLASRTKAKKPAGAFVSWWRNGRLTDGDHYWAVIERLNQYKKEKPEERDARREMASMPHAEYQKLQKERQDRGEAPQQPPAPEEKQAASRQPEAPRSSAPKPTTTSGNRLKGAHRFGDLVGKFHAKPEPKVPFKFEQFQQQFPEKHQEIEADIRKRMQAAYNMKDGAEVSIPDEQMERLIRNSVEQHCEKWYNEVGGIEN